MHMIGMWLNAVSAFSAACTSDITLEENTQCEIECQNNVSELLLLVSGCHLWCCLGVYRIRISVQPPFLYIIRFGRSASAVPNEVYDCVPNMCGAADFSHDI